MLYEKILYHSEVGYLTVLSDDYYIRKISFGKSGPYPSTEWHTDHPLLSEVEQQLIEYFDGKRQTFTLPIAFNGTPFQIAVWNALQQIPYGEMITYGTLAQMIGQPKAARAVGGGCNKNPIAIIIPCHRVIGANGSLIGFGGGITIKEKLLTLEKRYKTDHN